LNSGETVSSAGGLYGAGGGGNDGGAGASSRSGGQGVIRIIWPGTSRTFPYVAGK
jgi:hypothetical protein